MIDNVCLNCGKVFIADRKKRYCSHRCGKTYWQREYRRKEKMAQIDSTAVCVFTDGVECSNRACLNCGWNPVVARQRLAMIMGRLKG